MALLVAIPDIHHDWDWAHSIIARYDESVRFVFTGDYVDYKRSRTYDHRQSCDFLNQVMEELGDRATWLLGNHDLNYHPLNNELHGALGCVGYNRVDADYLTRHMPWKRLQIAHPEAGFLFTHAGLAEFDELEDCLTVEELAARINRDWAETDASLPHPYLTMFGFMSGGRNLDSGPLWHRPVESPLLPVNQICGHTPQMQPMLRPCEGYPEVQHWYMDCIQSAWLEIDTESRVATPCISGSQSFRFSLV